MAKPIYIIAKSVHETLELDRINFLMDLVKKARKQDLTKYTLEGQFTFKRANAYLMGGIGERITHLYKCCNEYGGCCFMPTIHSKDMCKGLSYFAENEVNFIGIARIGQFHTKNLDGVGDGLWDLTETVKKYMLLSLGRNGMEFQKMSYRSLTKSKMEIENE